MVFRPIVGLPFLRPRWSVGKGFWSSWVRVFVGRFGVAVQQHRRSSLFATDGGWIDVFYWEAMDYRAKEDWVMNWIKKLRSVSKNGKPIVQEAKDSTWIQAYPALHEYLTCASEDGKIRQTATLNLFTESGQWKAWLNDREEDASLCASAETVDGVLGALEAMLESVNPPWRLRPRPAKEESQKPRKRS